MSPPRAVAIASCLALASPAALAQPRGEAPNGALGALATALVEGSQPSLRGFPLAPRSVGVRVAGGVPEPLAARLDEVLRATLTAAGGPGSARVEAVTEGLDVEQSSVLARGRGLDALLFVALTREQNHVAASVTVMRLRPSLWETFFDPTPGPPVAAGEARASARVDASLRALLGPAGRWPSAPLSRPRMIATPFRNTVALAVGDLDADGRDEVVLATTERVRVARFTGGSLAFVAEASLGPLGLAPSPLRQPLGAAAWAPETRRVRVRTSRQSALGEVSLSGNTLTLTPLAGADLYPAQGYGCVALAPGGDTVRALSTECARATAPLGGTVAAVPVALARPDAQGTPHRVEALADGAGGCEVRVDGARVASLTDVAPPLALEDLDDDGRVELLTASATAPGASDRVRVFTIQPSGVEERPGFSVPGPIEALAVGDLDGDGFRDVVVGALDPQRRATTLWVLP